jgi:anti-anti-sigma factor
LSDGVTTGQLLPRFHQVSLVGEIDVANACVHGDLLCQVLDLGAGDTLFVDCHQLAFLDLRGMAMMQRVHRRGVECGTSVRWVGVSPAHRRLLALAGLEHRLFIDDAPTVGVVHAPQDNAARSSDSQ